MKHFLYHARDWILYGSRNKGGSCEKNIAFSGINKSINSYFFMRLIKLIFYILFFSLTFVSCQDNEYEGGGFVTLRLNQSCTLSNGKDPLTLSFVDAVDGRCPMGACELCCFSRADIFLSITDSKGIKANMDLGIWGCMYEVIGDSSNYNNIDTLGYRFSLFKLSPYPDVNPINKNDYTAKIKITKL